MSEKQLELLRRYLLNKVGLDDYDTHLIIKWIKNHNVSNRKQT